MDETPEPIVPGSGIRPEEQKRIERISGELRAGIEELGDIGPAVSIFGSARAAPDSWAYRCAQALDERLATAARIADAASGLA